MRVIHRAAATAVVAALTVLLIACDPAPTQPVARDRAAAWLVDQFGSDDLIAASFDPSLRDLGGTAYSATNLMAVGSGRGQARAALDAVSHHVDEYVVDAHGDDLPGSLARLIIAVESVGGNPRTFGGSNLVARLEATSRTTGADEGLFGVQDATYDGAFRQGISLAALSLVTPKPASIRAGDGPIRNRPVVRWLRDQQCADGSWMPYRHDLAEPCAFDPDLYSGPDTNSTALGVLGLLAVGARTKVDAGAWLTSVRGRDGGWSFTGGSDTGSDPDSTGLVLAAREALGTAIDEAGFQRLVSFQFGPSAPADQRGAFWYPPFDSSPPSPNLLATNDALTALQIGVWPASAERCATSC
jgi:hypothetical protein